jgi:hypothetical protein
MVAFYERKFPHVASLGQVVGICQRAKISVEEILFE